MRLCIHRGSKQIGGSCVEVESCGRRLLIDFGLPLDAEENYSQYLPQIAGLDGSDPSLLGILISHPHLDHFGLLAHISSKIPVGMGAAARRILEAAAPFLPGNRPVPAQGWNYQSGQWFDIGPFRVTPFLVDHSAYDAYALQIESGGKSIFYSGDFRAHGRKAALFVPHAQRLQIKKNTWFDLLKHHETNRIYLKHHPKTLGNLTLLFRPLHMSDLERENCMTGAAYIYSQWEGYWEQGSYDMVKDWLVRHAIPKHSIHTSGHASPVDLKKLVAAIKPRKVVPIHSFMPERYPELFPHVETHHDGEWWEV